MTSLPGDIENAVSRYLSGHEECPECGAGPNITGANSCGHPRTRVWISEAAQSQLPGDIEMELEDRPDTGREDISWAKDYVSKRVFAGKRPLSAERSAGLRRAFSARNPPKAGLPNHPKGGK